MFDLQITMENVYAWSDSSIVGPTLEEAWPDYAISSANVIMKLLLGRDILTKNKKQLFPRVR